MRIKLREMINRLEELSKNGKNDNMEVEIFDDDENDFDIQGIYIATYETSNEMYDYIRICV